VASSRDIRLDSGRLGEEMLTPDRFLRVRYNVTWHRLRGLDHPLRIGDVLILPITAFSSGGEPDFQAGDEDDPQADVVHDGESAVPKGPL
jgi:alpha 1,6-mannosyltransferase